ncbi:thioredoxin [Candidatus Dependentiae bacterium]|jgi:thioredoxin 1|nr:thioredoxin [Candidatus Dependentiae bacterium]
MAESVNAANFEQEVLKSTIPVVVDVWATWCGPCRQMAPIYEELSKELEGTVKLVSLNIDEERDLAIAHNVSSIPTFIFFKDGKVVGKETGFMNKDALKGKIDTHLK